MATGAEAEESLRAKFSALLPHLDERQQRLYLGSEARSLGHGGIAAVARAAGVSRPTVTAGVTELEADREPLGRARRLGGGRKTAEGTDPGLVAALLALVEPRPCGDPHPLLQWTTKSTRCLAAELTRHGHRCGPDTVARLLKQESFTLRGTKPLAGNQYPDRDARFGYVNDQAMRHRASGDAVISVDASKKRLVGAGWASVAADHDTAEFAAAAIRTWWQKAGRLAFPGARRLLIAVDGCGPCGHRARLWNAEVAQMADQTGLQITVCNLPPGTFRWSRIEHRLSGHICMDGQGQPATSHEVAIQTIAASLSQR
jgi:hypothetical protein